MAVAAADAVDVAATVTALPAKNLWCWPFADSSFQSETGLSRICNHINNEFISCRVQYPGGVHPAGHHRRLLLLPRRPPR